MSAFASRIGWLVCAIGSVLVLVSYGLPWITYRVIGQPDGTVESITWTGSDLAGRSFPLSVVLYGLPFLMAVIITRSAIRLTLRGPAAPRRPMVVSLVISPIALIAFSLLLLWLAAPDTTLPPEPSPLPGVGLLWLYLGYLAVIAGGVLVCLRQPRRMAPQLA